MAKKKGNKAAAESSAAAAAAEPASASSAAAASGTFLDDLSAEDRKFALAVGSTSAAELERAKAKLEANTKKAAEEQKKQLAQNEKQKQWEKETEKKARGKQRDDRKWEQDLEKAKQRALKEGVLQAEDWGDDKWWVKIDGDTYKEVQGNYFCTLCEKHLNDHTLEAHIISNDHVKKVAWAMPGAAASSSCPAAPRPPASPQANRGYAAHPGGALEDWQEMTADGYFKCIPCGKVIDENHLAKQDHINRLDAWRCEQQQKKSGYPAPELPYLAWVSSVETDPNAVRWMKCLLCSKWAQDEWSHTGTQNDPQGSKEHAKNLRNYGPDTEWYQQTVTRERLKWHPNAAPTASTARPAASSPWIPYTTPEGQKYYHDASTGESVWVWEVPWKQYSDERGRTYYHNEGSNETEWELPPGARVVRG